MTVESAPLDKSPRAIRSMFGRVAGTYDLMNRLLSLGLDVHWRRRARAALDLRPGELALDLCSGTGDLALELSRGASGGASVLAVDFTFEMLALGKAKLARAGARVPEAAADALRLPFPSGSFDAVTAAFGVRNFEDLERGSAEALRVLRPGGRFLILEVTPESRGPLRPAVNLYTRHLLPFLGNVLSGSRAYGYFSRSMSAWPPPEELSRRLVGVGFASVSFQSLFPGTVALHTARKGTA